MILAAQVFQTGLIYDLLRFTKERRSGLHGNGYPCSSVLQLGLAAGSYQDCKSWYLPNPSIRHPVNRSDNPGWDFDDSAT